MVAASVPESEVMMVPGMGPKMMPVECGVCHKVRWRIPCGLRASTRHPPAADSVPQPPASCESPPLRQPPLRPRPCLRPRPPLLVHHRPASCFHTSPPPARTRGHGERYGRHRQHLQTRVHARIRQVTQRAPALHRADEKLLQGWRVAWLEWVNKGNHDGRKIPVIKVCSGCVETSVLEVHLTEALDVLRAVGLLCMRNSGLPAHEGLWVRCECWQSRSQPRAVA